MLTDGHGTPLAVALTGGNRNDVTQLMPLLDKVPPVRGRVGRPRRRPERLLADRGYDHDKYRRMVWAKGIKPVIARRGSPHGSGLGVHRYVVERTIGLLHWFRRLRIRWETRDDIHEAFHDPGRRHHLLAPPRPLILLRPLSLSARTGGSRRIPRPLSYLHAVAYTSRGRRRPSLASEEVGRVRSHAGGVVARVSRPWRRSGSRPGPAGPLSSHGAIFALT